MYITFHHKQNESSSILTFYFSTTKAMSFIPGQFVELTIPHEKPDGRGTKRWFTIASSPNSTLIGITTRIVSDASSFKLALQALNPGDTVSMSEPMGDFVLPMDREIPLLFVAGGIGITPFHSIAQWLAENNEQRTIRLLHAITTEDDLIFTDTFQRAGILMTPFVSEPSPAWGGERGQLTAHYIKRVAESQPNTLIYIAGPERMTENLTKDLLKLDTEKHTIVTDYFPGYTDY